MCTDDQMLPTWTQETMLAQAGDWVEVKRMDAGHSPWMSREEEFNTWFESAVQKLVGLKADK